MSQDLFAAFGSAIPTSGTPDNAGITYALSSVSKGQDLSVHGTRVDQPTRLHKSETTESQEEIIKAVEGAGDDEDDDFGDFEDASTSDVPKYTAHPVVLGANSEVSSTALSATKAGSKTSLPKAAMQQAVSRATPNIGITRGSVGHHPFAGRMDFLFETDDDEYNAGTDDLGDLASNPEAAMAYSKRLIAQQEAARVRWEGSVAVAAALDTSRTADRKSKATTRQDAKAQPNKLRKKSGYAPPTRPAEVLFDADEMTNENDDSFGDFEDWNEPVATSIESPKPGQVDLLGIHGSSTATTTGSASITIPVNNETSPVSLDQSSKRTSVAVPKENEVVLEEEDAWDDFEAAEPAQRPIISDGSAMPTLHSRSTSNANAIPASSISALPPTNIPPPVVLLSLFPPLFAAADDALFDTMAKLDLKQRQMLLSHPASHQFLSGYIGHCTVLAHIIAGRKSRWKRDQRLSQSMRIGPAAAGGKGGMKLTGLDKSEAAKEDREVLDTVGLWKAQAGKLRTAITAASLAPGLPTLRSAPDISEQMPIKTLRPSEGGVLAAHACALCGLKREERVSKVDVEIEDSFGEWWLQDMNMHVSCFKFWDEFEKKLKSR